MGLENGDYIGDLDQTNPVTATDPVSEGAAHLRLVKRALRGSFPQFAGTQAAPKTVNLSEDQINDAARKLADNAFTGSNSFSQTVNFGNEIIAGNIVAGSGSSIFLTYNSNRRRAITISAQNAYRFGDSDLDTQLQGLSITAFHGAGAQSVFRTVDRAAGSLEIANSGGVFGAVAAVHKAQTFALIQTLTAGANFGDSATFDNTKAVRFKTTDTTPRAILQLASDDRAYLGDNNVQLVMRGKDAVRFDFNSASVAQLATRANGSLLVYDRNNAARKVGFRNPRRIRDLTASGALLQNDEGQIVRATGNGITITVPQLEEGTQITITNRSGFGSNDDIIALATGISANVMLGNELYSRTGQITLERGGVLHIQWESATTVNMWGSGLDRAA